MKRAFTDRQIDGDGPLSQTGRGREDLRNKVGLVTGASSGIGAAVARELGRAGMQLVLTGRNPERLGAVAAETGASEIFVGDLEADGVVAALSHRAIERFGGVDLLAHSAGLFLAGTVEATPVAALIRLFRLHVVVPYCLTQALLPALVERKGQVVFINSSAGAHPAKAELSGYAASKHALHALADSLREEVNPRGVRVISVYPGRTATPMQEEVHRFERRAYLPERFLTPQDVAAAVLSAVTLPRTAEMTDLHVRPFSR